MSYLLRAIFELGLPVAGLSWLLFYRLYHRGELARDADRGSIRSRLKQMKKSANKADTAPDPVLQKKWMKFGGGFYGMAALWTLIVVEVSGGVSVIAHPSSIESMVEGGVIHIIIDWLLGQASTFVQAMTWFNWWPGPGESTIVWFLVPMAGYVAGLELARHETAAGTRLTDWNWRSQLRAWFDNRKGG